MTPLSGGSTALRPHELAAQRPPNGLDRGQRPAFGRGMLRCKKGAGRTGKSALEPPRGDPHSRAAAAPYTGPRFAAKYDLSSTQCYPV